jgi:Cft2 family RNA processing exonuclease
MDLTFLGGASEVGASCTLLHVAGHRLLIDGGMRPAAKAGQPRLPDLALLEGAPPEALLITHAHIDHTGALPLVASRFPHLPIYASDSTRVLTDILLRDAVRIMEQEQLRPEGETPLYDAAQVDAFLGRITTVNVQQAFAPLPSVPGLTVRFLPAGHILGASMLFFETPEGTLLHTGDISVTDQRTIKGLDVQGLPQADVMVCEGTYGNRTHTKRKEEERKLAETVQSVLARGGRILCPAFAVGRAQEVVLILKAYRASGQVSPVPIYLDGMVRSVCTAYHMQAHDLHPNLQRYLKNARRPLFADPDLQIFAVRSQDRAALVRRTDPMIVISSSGMLTGGASPVYAAEIATRPQDCILFTGYQDEESPGAALLRAQTGDVLRLGEQTISLACQVARYNLSGHADAEQIVHVVTKVTPRHLILVHGAPESLEALARRFPRLHVAIPEVGSRLVFTARSSVRPPSAPKTGASIPVPSAPALPEVSSQVSAGAPPTIRDLWTIASCLGPARPWTSVELGQHYYGRAYRPTLRVQVEQALAEASAYFKIGRVGAQSTYLPRSHSETEQLHPISQLPAGSVVLVQGQKATPQIALLLTAPREGTVTLVAEQWKAGTRPMNLIQLVPHLRREDLLALPAEEIRASLRAWRRQLEQEWVDLFVWWAQSQGRAFSYASLCAHLTSDDLHLAWGSELLEHGHELFHRDGPSWTPVEEQRVLSNAGFVHHLELLEAGAGTHVLINGRRGTLTGRSTWRYFEVRWEAGEEAGELTRVREHHVQVVGEARDDVMSS